MESQGFSLAFLDDLADSFKITGNKDTDKIIILVGGVLLILVAFNIVFGGKK